MNEEDKQDMMSDSERRFARFVKEIQEEGGFTEQQATYLAHEFSKFQSI